MNYNVENDYRFGQIPRELIFGKIHYKYNFRIQPCSNFKKFSVRGKGSNIKLFYPEIFNFLTEEEKTFRFITDNPELVQNVKFNEVSPELKCEDLY